MKRAISTMTHEFVEFVPDVLEDGILYVSMNYATVSHRCCCGCGTEVVTPLSPTDWSLIYDGKSVSLDPSIGNWSFACQSHYWIRNGSVRWANRWSRAEIAAGRAADKRRKTVYFDESANAVEAPPPTTSPAGSRIIGVLRSMKKLLKWRS